MSLAFHLDEDADEHALLFALRERGIDMTSTGEMRMGAMDDSGQLLWAHSQRRTLITYNAADFCRLHKELMESGRHHSGIIIAQQQRLSVGEMMRRLLRLAAAFEQNQMGDRLEFLNRW